MQYVNGHDIANQSIIEVQTLALSNRIPWSRLISESNDPDSSIWGYHSHEKGIYLNRGICDFNISPEHMFDILYTLNYRTQWDIHCKEAYVEEEYDQFNHIIRMVITHPLGLIKMNLYRSCKYDPQKRLYIIAMRSVELEDCPMENWFECLPNGWIIQGIEGQRDKCRLMFVQQCHIRDIENQSIPGYKSFESREQLGDFHYLTIFPASVGGRLGKIFECLKSFIHLNAKEIEIKDTRLKILEQTERQVNELFGTTTIDYGFTSHFKKYDMELLVKKVGEVYCMIAKGSFSSLYTPAEIADILYCDDPWGWDPFYEKSAIIENMTPTSRELALFYRMWHESFTMKVLQSVKKGPGNCSAVIWRSIESDNTHVPASHKDMELGFLPSGIFSYGLGEGSFTSFLVGIEVKGAKTSQEEDLVAKLFAARVISTQNHIINVMNRTNTRMVSQNNPTLPVIPTPLKHSEVNGYQYDNDLAGGSPAVYNDMVENFANLLLADSIAVNQKKAQRDSQESAKSKRKRNYVDESESESADNNQQSTNGNETGTVNDLQQQQLLQQQLQQQQQLQEQEQYRLQYQQQRILHLQQQQKQRYPNIQSKRPTIRVASNITAKQSTPVTSTTSTSQPYDEISTSPASVASPNIPVWNTSKRQPFLFLVSESNDVKRLTRKDVTLSNSHFDNLPEEIVQTIFSFLGARDILLASMVCKRFKVTTDCSILWKQLYLSDPIFSKGVPKRYRPIQQAPTININPEMVEALQSVLGPDFDISKLAPLLQGGQVEPEILQDLTVKLSKQFPENPSHEQPQTPQTLQEPQVPQPNQVEQYIQFIKTMLVQQQQQQQQPQPQQQQSSSGDDNGGGGIARMCGCRKQCLCICQSGCNCGCLNEDIAGISNWRNQYLQKIKLDERWGMATPKKTIELNGHSKNIRQVRSVQSSAVSLSADKKVKFWNLNSGQSIGTYEEPGTTVLSIEYDKTSKSSVIWPLSDYTKVHIGHKNGLVSLVDFMERPHVIVSSQRPVLLADGFDFTSPGRYIIWENITVDCWDEEKKVRLWQATDHTKKVQQARSMTSTLFANGLVCSASSDKTVKIRNISDGVLIASLSGYTGVVNCLEPVGDYLLASGSSDKYVKLWDYRKLNTPVFASNSHSTPIRALSYEENGGRLISGGDDGVVVLRELNNWNRGRRECIGVPTSSNNNHQHHQHQSGTDKDSVGTVRESGRLLQHKSGVTSIDSDESGIIVGYQDGLIYRYDFS